MYLINEQHARLWRMKCNVLHRHDTCSCQTMRYDINEHVKRYDIVRYDYLPTPRKMLILTRTFCALSSRDKDQITLGTREDCNSLPIMVLCNLKLLTCFHSILEPSIFNYEGLFILFARLFDCYLFGGKCNKIKWANNDKGRGDYNKLKLKLTADFV